METCVRVCKICLLNIYTKSYIKTNKKYYHEKCYQIKLDNEISQFLNYYDKICAEENYTIKCVKIITTKKNYKLTKKVQVQIVSNEPNNIDNPDNLDYIKEIIEIIF
jgi:hypothetical protein